MTNAQHAAPKRFDVRFTGYTVCEITVEAASYAAARQLARHQFDEEGFDAVDEIACGYCRYSATREGGAL